MTRLLALASLVAACSTNYVPRSPGRVAVTMEDGAPAYVRDGQSYRHGFLGSGLRKAVRGNPQAEAAADEYHDRIRDGLLVTLLGGVCMGTALGMAISEIDENSSSSDRRAQTEVLVALGCTGLMLGGALYTATAEPYRWDAINIFNDNPPPPPPGLYPGYGPGYGAAKAPAERRLGMRE